MPAQTRKAGPERRKEVARAVLRIIGEQGLTALTTTTLAREVGVTSGALFRHFASRDEMLKEAVRYGLARIGTTLPDESLPPIKRLFDLARNRVNLLGSDPGIAWLLRSSQAHLVLPEESVQQLAAMVERSKQSLRRSIREGRSQGSIRSDIEPEILLVVVMGTIHALAGMPGVHRIASHDRRSTPERVLSGLKLLLAPAGDALNEDRTATRARDGQDG